MTAHVASAAVATVLASAFALSTFERWLARRRRHELAWSVALGQFALGAASLLLGAAAGWSPASFRAFYLFGAILNVPFLALGTVYLLAGERAGDRTAAALVALAAFSAGVVVAVPLRGPISPESLPQGSDVFGALPRVLAAVASSGGAAAVFGGAVWSIARARRGRLALANGLIALGTLVLSAGGLANSVLDEMTAFAVTLAVGIAVIFAGFLVAGAGAAAATRRREAAPRRATPAAPAPGTAS